MSSAIIQNLNHQILHLVHEETITDMLQSHPTQQVEIIKQCLKNHLIYLNRFFDQNEEIGIQLLAIKQESKESQNRLMAHVEILGNMLEKRRTQIEAAIQVARRNGTIPSKF